MFREKPVKPYSPRGAPMPHRQYRAMRTFSRLKRSRGLLIHVLWISCYFCITLVALLCSYVLPEVLHMLRSTPHHDRPSLLLSKGDLGGQSHDRLVWNQEMFPSHHLRSTKLALKSEEEELEEQLWAPPADKGFVPCIKPDSKYLGLGQATRGYLMVSANGGLNQMRAGICDMVAIARLINATLVIPELDKRSFWQDSSNFSDVFDIDYFIKSLSNDVPVVVSLPSSMKSAPKVIKQFKSWSSLRYYEEDVGRLWQHYKVIKASKTDSRLANNHLPLEIQKLRCRVHYDALRFAPHIEALGKVLVNRMRAAGPYIALHLRYEKDMLAFSGCTHGLTVEESKELTLIRENTPYWRIKKIDAKEQRNKGLCPLTPREVGIFLKALGYPETTRVYIAAGEIYGGSKRMSGLLSRFPHVMSKETIATAEELAPYVNHSSQMAALDYIVAVESDVFVPSYSGNMARAVEGHRRFLGHRKTIIPDRQGAPRKRAGSMRGFKGRDRFRSEEAFYTNPTPDCLCQQRTHHSYEPVKYRRSSFHKETYRGVGQLQQQQQQQLAKR